MSEQWKVCHTVSLDMFEGSLEVELPTIWTDEKQRWSRRIEKRREEKRREGGVRSQLARWEMKNCTPLWREAHFEVKTHKTPHVRTAFGSCDVEKVRAVVARSTFPLKMYKTDQVRTTFGSWDVEKVHAVVARSTFPSQNVQNTSRSDRFWKLRCRKSARRCGAKHISTQNVKKTGSDHFWKLRCRKSVRRCGAQRVSKSKW